VKWERKGPCHRDRERREEEDLVERKFDAKMYFYFHIPVS